MTTHGGHLSEAVTVIVNWSDWPLWATLAKRLITALILAAFALHAYRQCQKNGKTMPASECYTFGAFSVALVFGVIINLVSMFLAVKYNQKQGPLGFGPFSLLIALVYLIFTYRSSHKVRYL